MKGESDYKITETAVNVHETVNSNEKIYQRHISDFIGNLFI